MIVTKNDFTARLNLSDVWFGLIWPVQTYNSHLFDESMSLPSGRLPEVFYGTGGTHSQNFPW